MVMVMVMVTVMDSGNGFKAFGRVDCQQQTNWTEFSVNVGRPSRPSPSFTSIRTRLEANVRTGQR